MGLKRVMWVRRYQEQCRALRPLGHQGYRLRSCNKDQPLCSGYKANPENLCKAFPREPTWCPALRPATHAPRGWANPDLSPPLSRTRGAHHRGHVLWQECPGTPLLLLVVATRGDPERVLGITPSHLYGAASLPRPPLPAPAARDEYTPSCEHRRSPPLRGST